ncbi:hypothetical protein ALPO108162_13060 [Alicyclobacillus pomorum]
MLQVALAEIRTRTDALETHLSHATLHTFAVYIPALNSQLLRDTSTPVDRMVRIYFVYSMFEL